MKTGLGLAAIGLVHFALVWDVARQKTPTLDEIAHVPAGISYLDQGTFKMYRFSPPLARLLVGLAAQTAHPKTDYDGTWRNHDPPNHWLFAFRFLLANMDEPARYLAAFERGRLLIALWSALTIPLVYCWGSAWFGRGAGWLAASLWALCPNIIAHGSLTTTDLASASTTLLAAWTFARWLDRPSWNRAGLAGICLGIAQLVKFSALLLYAILPLWGLVHVYWTERQARRQLEPLASRWPGWTTLALSRGVQMAGIVAVSVLILGLGYGFEGLGRPLGEFPFVSKTLTRLRTAADGDFTRDLGSSKAYNDMFPVRVNRFRGTWLASLPCPLPMHYVAGFDEQRFESEGGYQMYLRGTLRRTGWWYYYFYALAVKAPLSTWLLLGLAVFDFVWSGERRGRHRVLWWLALAPLLAMSLLTDINLGLRYVLPVLPFLFLLAGSAARPSQPRWRTALVWLCIAWNVGAIARIHPHELAYFNELVGGPENGRFHLIDSNLDWGQDLRGLVRWLEKHPEWSDVRLAYLGTVPPEFEGLSRYQMAPRDIRNVPPTLLWPGEDLSDPATYGPQPGRYAVSVNFERGMQFHTPCPFAMIGQVTAQHPRAFQPAAPMLFNPNGVYRYFQHLVPRIEPEIGYSILLYEVSAAEADRVRRAIGLPLLRLENPPEVR